jgi:hypothetical protein
VLDEEDLEENDLDVKKLRILNGNNLPTLLLLLQGRNKTSSPLKFFI